MAHATRSPTDPSATSAPTAETTPAPSEPAMNGVGFVYTPERWYTSRKLTPDAETSTRTWPGLGSGVSKSLTCKACGPPCCSTTTARMRPPVGFSSTVQRGHRVLVTTRDAEPDLH